MWWKSCGEGEWGEEGEEIRNKLNDIELNKVRMKRIVLWLVMVVVGVGSFGEVEKDDELKGGKNMEILNGM